VNNNPKAISVSTGPSTPSSICPTAAATDADIDVDETYLKKLT